MTPPAAKSPRPHFDEPPIAEAVFDLIAEPSGVATNLADAFFAELPEYTSAPQELQQFEMHMQVDAGRVVSHGLDAAVQAQRRWNDARDRAVLVGRNVLAYNVLPPYGHFDDHAPELERILERYWQIAKPRRVALVGQRFINHVSLPLDDAASRYFKLYPALPDAFARRHPPVSVQVETVRFENGVVHATLALARSDAQEAVYVLELYAHAPGGATSVTQVLQWHRVAHDAVVDSFLAAITPDARGRFRERPCPRAASCSGWPRA